MLTTTVSFPLYNCPNCGDGHDFCPPTFQLLACRVDGKKLPLLTQRQLDEVVYPCDCCGYELQLAEYFAQQYVPMTGTPVGLRPHAVWDGLDVVLQGLLQAQAEFAAARSR